MEMSSSSSKSKSGMGIEKGSGLFWKADPAKKDLGGEVSAGVLVGLLDDAGVLLALVAFLDDLVVDEGPVGGLLLPGVAVEESLAGGLFVGEDFWDFLVDLDDDDDVCDFVGTMVETAFGTDLEASGSREFVSAED